jgi:hypothetical protein
MPSDGFERYGPRGSSLAAAGPIIQWIAYMYVVTFWSGVESSVGAA